MRKWMCLGSFIVGMAALLTSCMHTYWGRTSYFPEGTDENTYAKRLIVDVHGASGHAYTDRTKKRVLVSLKDREGRFLVQGEYTVHAGALRWNSRELGDNGFELLFYEVPSEDVDQTDGGSATQVLALKYNGEELAENREVTQAPEWALSRESTIPAPET